MNLSQIVANGFHKTFTGSDITITEAKMKACEEFLINGKAVTKRKQEALWGRYIPCDGITNGANTSIDTGIKAQDNMELLVRFKASTGSFYILQARQNTGATIYGISGAQSGNTLNTYGVTSGINRTSGHVYTVKMTMVNRAVTLYVKDETDGTEDTKTGTASASDYTFPSPTTIKLFGDASMVASGVTVYRAYIKINGQMAWDMYPCADVNNSNAPVAYDDVTHAKSTVVSGNITGGSLIQPISYAESNGSAWADTEIIPKTFDYTITYEGAIKKIDAGPNCAWGYMGNGSSIQIPRWMCAGYNNGYLMNANETTTILSGDTNNHTFVCKVYDNGGTPYWSSIIDGVEKQNKILTSSSSWIANTSSIYLFARNNVDGAGNFAPATLKRWICEKAGVVIKHIIPVRIGTTVELLDLVSWTFATRTGTFTAGADVPYADLCPDILETNAGDVLYDWVGTQGVVDLGTLNWIYQTDGTYPVFRATIGAPFVGSGTPPMFTTALSIHSAVITATYLKTNLLDGVIAYQSASVSNQVMVQDSRYTSVADFKSAMSGKYLYYQRTGDPTFIPPTKQLIPSGEQRVVTQGKNLADISTAVLGDINSTTGAINTNVTYRIVTDFVPVKNGVTHVGNAELIATDGTIGSEHSVIIGEYDANKQFISGTRRIASARKFTITDNATAYVRVEYYCGNIGNGKTIDLTQSWILLEVGETSTFYEPYSAPQVRTITTFLPSANSFIDAQKAVNNAECDWKFKVLDGTESYAWGNPSVTLRWTGMETLKTGIAPVCNVLEGVASFTTGAQIIVYNSTSFRLRIPGITGSDDAKQIITDLYKAGKPMIIAYPLATPEVTTVEIAPVTLANGTNRVTASSGTVKVTANVRVI